MLSFIESRRYQEYHLFIEVNYLTYYLTFQFHETEKCVGSLGNLTC